jgi:DNA polymerase-1
MFNVPLEEMTPDVRRQAKAINFGVIYGISGFGLARNLRIPGPRRRASSTGISNASPASKDYMDDTKKFAKSNGYVADALRAQDPHARDQRQGAGAGFAARAAINAPIQGTAADVIRRAMIRMEAAIEDLPAVMLLQVHDELLFEVDEGSVDALIAAARDVMEGAAHPAVHLAVPLVVDAGQGANWAEAH